MVLFASVLARAFLLWRLKHDISRVLFLLNKKNAKIFLSEFQNVTVITKIFCNLFEEALDIYINNTKQISSKNKLKKH